LYSDIEIINDSLRFLAFRGDATCWEHMRWQLGSFTDAFEIHKHLHWARYC